MNRYKAESCCLLAAVLFLAAASFPLVAQSEDLHHIYAHPPIQIANEPQNPGVPTGIFPAQFKAAYGFNRIPNQGQGQTIALIDAFDDPDIESDLAVYKAQFHLGPCNFQKIKVGNPAASYSWAIEESLDVEQACALAPQANILVVEATTNSMADLLDAVFVAYSAPHNATVISMSWGDTEFQTELDADNIFCGVTNGNGQPVIFVAASGDGGHGIIYPSASRCVIAAGGTELVLSSTHQPSDTFALDYGQEVAWIDGGGGLSRYESQPSWQNSACAPWSTAARCVPDIASDSDPGTGVPAYDSYFYGGWFLVGGTSLATPDWASFFTLVNSQRVSQGAGLLSQPAQDLYAIYDSGNYPGNFHDITSGNNGSCGSQCQTGPGYDLVTGLGSYQAQNLFAALVAAPN